MEEGLLKKTGKALTDWITIVGQQNFEKHGEIIKFLKEKHEFTYGYVNFVAHKSRESDAGSKNTEYLIANQYKGKETLWPIYELLMAEIKNLAMTLKLPQRMPV